MSLHLFPKVSCFIQVLLVMMEDEAVAENWDEVADGGWGENSAERTSGQHGCAGCRGSPLRMTTSKLQLKYRTIITQECQKSSLMKI